MCLLLVMESVLNAGKCVLSAVNQRRPEAVRYTSPSREMLRSESRVWTQEESRIPWPDCNSTYFHSSSDAVYFENIPIFMAGHRSHRRFKVLPLSIQPHLS